MFKVIIVEDEMLVRIGLKNSIDWAKLGMEVIADLSNGQAAWDFYNAAKPDLILTDIRMPNMDGMQLISLIRENDAKTKIVILTAYEEFDLVKKAIRFGVTDYILKFKMSIDEMESVLRKVQTELQSENSRASAEQQDPPALDRTSLKETAMKDYLSYGRYSDAEFAEITKKLNFRLQPERLLLCVMSIDNFERMERKFHDNHGNLIRFSILNIVSELLAGYDRGEVIYEKDAKYILVFSFHDIVSEQRIYLQLQDILSHISNVIKTYLNASVTFGISTIQTGYSLLRQLYQEGVGALEQSFILSSERFIRWDTVRLSTLRSIVGAKLEKMLRESKPFNERHAKEIEAGTQALIRLDRISRLDVQIMMIRWIHWPTVNLNPPSDDISAMALDYAGQIHDSATLDETIEIFQRYLRDILNYNEKKKYLSKEIAEAIQFIREHYDEEVSLQQIAEQVHLNPSYLSRLFKKELQMSYVEYLNFYRIDMAKNLLLNTRLKSYEIAQKTGYWDDSYFSRTFKKMTGMRPHEFRRQWLADSREEREDGHL
ncbi:two-component system response regulator YesN [Paenibacillus taihuensis]|uniref:Two-component system response regulator YesN n=1 Tax=Paenibacillus taihuensis TaxID=1156355 RepID=A0A3D9R1M2_9BACL|nr:response regulator [Paenibacillus taihuensis]REE68118.1 two-component system response regulator YesN [Paenibacillus taihuensis]